MLACAKAKRRHLLQGITITIGLAVLMLSSAGCGSGLLQSGPGGMPGDAAPVVKIALIAPFEGVDRPLGYEVLSAVKGVLTAANSSAALRGYRVALVALNDNSDPQAAAAQARALLLDEDVLAVVGLWSSATARAAAPILENGGLPAVLAAPYAEDSTLVRSLCPSLNDIAAELLREADRLGLTASLVVAGPQNALMDSLLALSADLFRSPPGSDTPCEVSPGMPVRPNCAVLYTGDAAEAAGDLARWRASGWDGPVLAGPDVVRSWFPLQADGAAEGIRGIVCAGFPDAPTAADQPQFEQAGLAQVGAETVLGALRRVIAGNSRPSRARIAALLNQEPPARYLDWLEVKDGLWTRMIP